MPPVDITFTVKASVSNGRRLMQNEDGTTFWEGDEPVPEGYFDGPPNPPLGYNVEADVLAAPVIEPPKVRDVYVDHDLKDAVKEKIAAKPRHKKLHHG